MAQYKVISNNCTLGKQGATIDNKDCDGISFVALVEGGHLEEIKAFKPQTIKEGN